MTRKHELVDWLYEALKGLGGSPNCASMYGNLMNRNCETLVIFSTHGSMIFGGRHTS
jgi:hypothetical protein